MIAIKFGMTPPGPSPATKRCIPKEFGSSAKPDKCKYGKNDRTNQNDFLSAEFISQRSKDQHSYHHSKQSMAAEYPRLYSSYPPLRHQRWQDRP